MIEELETGRERILINGVDIFKTCFRTMIRA